jgi:hypothetical protein
MNKQQQMFTSAQSSIAQHRSVKSIRPPSGNWPIIPSSSSSSSSTRKSRRQARANKGVRAFFGGLKKTERERKLIKRLEKLGLGGGNTNDNKSEEDELWMLDNGLSSKYNRRQAIMAGNWKCNPSTLEQARTLAALVAANASSDVQEKESYGMNNMNMNKRKQRVDVLICPPAAFISEVSQLVRFLSRFVYSLDFYFSTKRASKREGEDKYFHC